MRKRFSPRGNQIEKGLQHQITYFCFYFPFIVDWNRLLKSFCINKQRIDGREAYDYRKLRILFGVDRGHCEVQLGETRYGNNSFWMVLRHSLSINWSQFGLVL